MIQLPGAPTREGYRFLYWEGSRYDAGASFIVDDPHAFTAKWEKIVDPTPSPTPPVAGGSTVSTEMPQTGDALPIVPVVVVVLIAGAVLAVCVRRETSL